MARPLRLLYDYRYHTYVQCCFISDPNLQTLSSFGSSIESSIMKLLFRCVPKDTVFHIR